jgi:hypothetical protein
LDNGGSEISLFELYRNDGDTDTELDIQVTSYDTNLLYHTLDLTTDSLTTGVIYKFVFKATNQVGGSEDSNIVEYALCDVPASPDAPLVMLDHTTESSIAVQWSQVTSLQAPGSDVTGYLLEMKDTRDFYGNYEVVFDGSDLYPDLRSFLLSDERVVSGNSYIFRVKANY